MTRIPRLLWAPHRGVGSEEPEEFQFKKIIVKKDNTARETSPARQGGGCLD